MGLVSSCALLVACGPAVSDAPDGPRPNLLLVTLDTTRADHTSALGYARDTTPHLRALADAGARFAAAYAPSPSTAPTHASLFTGLYPIGHGLVKNTLALPEEIPTLAARLADAGYATAGVVSAAVLDSRFGLARGFDTWDERFPPEHASLVLEEWEGVALEGGFDRRADATTDAAIAWLRARPEGRPFFLFVHYFDPHYPYTPPPEHAGRFGDGTAPPDSLEAAIDAYDAEIAAADAGLGRLLAALAQEGVVDDTLVAVAGDHGEGLMDHGHMEHGIQLFEEAVRVPLVLRWPDRIAAGSQFDAPVPLVDLAPTLAALLGVSGLPDAHGRDLSDALLGRGESLDPERAIYLQSDRPLALRRHPHLRGVQWAAGEMFGVRAGRWKYLEDRRRGTSALFDLALDPDERENLAEREAERAAALAAQLERWKRAHVRPEPVAPELSESEIELFRALGYVE